MRVLALTLGTRGDVEIALAIGRALAGRGHAVTVATSPFFEPAVRAAGLGLVRVGDGTRAALVALMRSLEPERDLDARAHAYFRGWVRPQLDAGRRALDEALAACDYFVNNLRMVRRRGARTVPGAALHYEPTGDPGRLARHAPARAGGAAVLRLAALERALVDPHGAWDPGWRFAGFVRPAPAAAGALPAPIDAFLDAGLAAGPDAGPDAGTPPAVLTLGSMTIADPHAAAHAFAEALARLGMRGIVVGGWSEAPPALGAHVCFAPEAPYATLFPRAACVIHHGGCGTVQAVLEAGRPSVLLPQITSQAHFARILEREGLAAGTLDPGALDPGALADAIGAAVHDPRHAEAARRWAPIVAAGDGAARAAALIEAHAAGREDG